MSIEDLGFVKQQVGSELMVSWAGLGLKMALKKIKARFAIKVILSVIMAVLKLLVVLFLAFSS